MRDKLISLIVWVLLIGIFDQVILTSPIADTKLRYAWITTQKTSAAGLFTPSCSAAAYRLTWISRWRLTRWRETAVDDTHWTHGAGFLKLATWGCGLAYYDHGGGGGQATKMYQWGEGRTGVWVGRQNAGCKDTSFILIPEGRVLCVSGAAIGNYLGDDLR